MSDFLYSTTPEISGKLSHALRSIYQSDKPSVNEFNGRWGSLAVSHNLHKGFQPLDTEKHIFVVIGGPVLCFQNNDHLSGKDSPDGSHALYHRWLNGTIKWDDDLSGPFVIFILEKNTGKIHCVTDLMMFIPVYQFQQDNVLTLGTHIDILAEISNQSESIDRDSVTNFILYSAVTFPHTLYKEIYQCQPASTQTYSKNSHSKIIHKTVASYWLPYEKATYTNINEAASALRRGLEDYVEAITDKMTQVAQFISAGEDSRAIAGLLPKKLDRDAFIFTDSQNRESQIAEKVSNIYNLQFHPEYRSKTHYLEILPEAVKLVGSCYQYTNAHTLRFHKSSKLTEYNAVFGGYISDTLLKASHSRTKGGTPRFPFIPKIFLSGENRSQNVENSLFTPETLKIISERRKKQFRTVQHLRPNTAHEWFVIWPSTMKASLTSFSCNRRLFCSFEPFLSNKVVKISAEVPVEWKLNRRLFLKATRSYFAPSKWISHPNGFYPYFPWWINSAVQFVIWFGRHVGKRIGLQGEKAHQGPWGDWNNVFKSKKWLDTIAQNKEGFSSIKNIFTEKNIDTLFQGNTLSRVQKINLLQILCFFKNKPMPQRRGGNGQFSFKDDSENV